MEVSARFAEKNESLDEKQYHIVPNDIGKVYLPTKGITYADILTFGLTKFLWMPRVTVRGAKA